MATTAFDVGCIGKLSSITTSVGTPLRPIDYTMSLYGRFDTFLDLDYSLNGLTETTIRGTIPTIANGALNMPAASSQLYWPANTSIYPGNRGCVRGLFSPVATTGGYCVIFRLYNDSNNNSKIELSQASDGTNSSFTLELYDATGGGMALGTIASVALALGSEIEFELNWRNFEQTAAAGRYSLYLGGTRMNYTTGLTGTINTNTKFEIGVNTVGTSQPFKLRAVAMFASFQHMTDLTYTLTYAATVIDSIYKRCKGIYLGHKAAGVYGGTYSAVAIGSGATVTSNKIPGIAIGYGASVSYTTTSTEASISIGTGAVCTSSDTILLGNPPVSGFYGPTIFEFARYSQEMRYLTTASGDVTLVGAAGAAVLINGWLMFEGLASNATLHLPSYTYFLQLWPMPLDRCCCSTIVSNFNDTGSTVTVINSTNAYWYNTAPIPANTVQLVKFRYLTSGPKQGTPYIEFFA